MLQVGDSTLQADWVSSTHISLRQLHSKCLYVDRLPPNYRDMANYRKIFSVVKNPPYCQVPYTVNPGSQNSLRLLQQFYV